MSDELADRDPALDPPPAAIREDAEREVEEVERDAHAEEEELRERAARGEGARPDDV